MLKYRHPEYSGVIENAWKRYAGFSSGLRMLREDMQRAYPEELGFAYNIIYPRLRKAVSDRDYPSFGVVMSFARRLRIPPD